MQPLIEAAEKNYLATGMAGMIAGWGGAAFSYLKLANEALTTLSLLFGTIAALFSALILVRKYFRNKD